MLCALLTEGKANYNEPSDLLFILQYQDKQIPAILDAPKLYRSHWTQ